MAEKEIRKIEYENGDIYEGKIKKNKRSGDGKMIYSNGEIYEGEWKKDKKNGYGTLKKNNRNIYQGYWKYDKKHGKGRIDYKIGNYYFGDWKNDIREGNGKLRELTGEIYEGEWKEDKRSGKGKLYNIFSLEKILYNGEWKDNLRNGFGKGIYKNMEIEAEWKDDKPNIGNNEHDSKIEFNNGDVYKGKLIFKSNSLNKNEIVTVKIKNKQDFKLCAQYLLFEGYGKMKYSNGDIYKGEWQNNKKHGKGKMEYLMGKIYEGEWNNNSNHGNGKMIYANGDIYDGSFLHNSKDGEGKMTYANGDIYKGIWKNNEKQTGKMIYANGEIYDGSFLHNLKGCEGKMTYANGDIYKGIWQNNKKQNGKMIYANGEIYEGKWENDKKYGNGKFISSNGEIYEGEFIDNIRYGKGKLILFDDFVYDAQFKNNLIINAIITTPNKDIIKCDNFINNMSNGFATIEYKNDNQYDGEIYDNLPHGFGKLIDDEGKIKIGMWKKGELKSSHEIKLKSCGVCTKYFEPHHFKVACGQCQNHLCNKCYEKTYNFKFVEKGEIFNKNRFICPFCRNIPLCYDFDDEDLENIVKDKTSNKIGRCKICSEYEKIIEDCANANNDGNQNNNINNNQNLNINLGFFCSNCSNNLKHCPSCKNWIEKNGGCKHMKCRCGFNFCWECLEVWSINHSYYGSCRNKNPYNYYNSYY